VIMYTDKYNHQSHRSHGHKVAWPMDTNSVLRYIMHTDKYNHQSHRSHGHKVSQSVDKKLHGLWTQIQ